MIKITKKVNIYKRGFTLIELLIVIAIIGILTSVVLASLNDAKKKARNAVRKSDARQIRNALSVYYLDFGGYPSASATPNFEVDIQNLTGELKPIYLTVIPNDPNPTIRNYQYVWGPPAAGLPQEYGLLIPFGNDAGQDCAFRTPGGKPFWFKVLSVTVPDCNY